MKVGDEVMVIGPSITGRTDWVGKKGIIRTIDADGIGIIENAPWTGTYPRDHVQSTKSYYIKKFIEVWNHK